MKIFKHFLFVVLLLLCIRASTSVEEEEKECKCVKICVFVLKGDKAKESRIKQTVERANDIWKQPCISFEADYKELDPATVMFPSKKDEDGKEVKVTLATLLVKGGLKLGAPLTKNDNGEVLDTNGKGTGVTVDDVLNALDKVAKSQCPEDSDGKSPIRAYPIKSIDGASLSGLAYEGKDGRGSITCDSGLLWDACDDHAGTTLAHEIAHNLGLRHPKKGTPEDTENNVAQEEPVNRDSSTCDYYTERPSFTEPQEKCACAVIEKCYQFKKKPCPTTRWDKVRCALEPIKEKYGPLLEKLNADVIRLLDEEEALLDEGDECKNLLKPAKELLTKAKAALEEACASLDEFICKVQEELAEYKELNDLKKRNKEQRARLRQLKKKYKQLAKDVNENREKEDHFPKSSESVDKEEIAETLAKNVEEEEKDKVYGEYRGLRDAKAAAEAEFESAAAGVKEIEDKLKEIKERLEKKIEEKKEAIKKRDKAKSEKDEETGKVTEESGIEVY